MLVKSFQVQEPSNQGDTMSEERESDYEVIEFDEELDFDDEIPFDVDFDDLEPFDIDEDEEDE